MNEIICDRCGTVLLPEIKTQKIEDLEFTYFVCEKCKTVYTISVTDLQTRKEIFTYNQLRKIMQKKIVSFKFQKMVEQTKRKLFKKGKELKEKYRLTYEDVNKGKQ